MDSWHSQRITSKILAAVPYLSHLNDVDKTSSSYAQFPLISLHEHSGIQLSAVVSKGLTSHFLLISFLPPSGFCSHLFSTLNPQNDEMWKLDQSEADALRFLIDSFLTNTQIWWTGLRSSGFGPCFGSRNDFNAKDTINLHQIILQFVSGNVLSKLTGSTR